MGIRHSKELTYCKTQKVWQGGEKFEWSHYMKTAGRKCFATAENPQVQFDHQTVTLHWAWRLRSGHGYLPHHKSRKTVKYLSLSLINNYLLSTHPPFSATSQSQPSGFLPLLSILSSSATLTHYGFFLPPPNHPSYHFSSNFLIALPHPPSLSLCLWSVTLNLASSICFSSFI